MKPFFTYYGGKYRIAPKYPRPKWAELVEPFAGSAGYSVRNHIHRVRLYDVNPKVVATWEYLIKTSPEEILALPTDFDDVRDLNVCQEAKWLIGWWLNKGTASPRNKPSKWMKSGTRDNSYWGEVVRERIANQVVRIRHWEVKLLPYYAIPLTRKSCWFVDPPYQTSGVHYPHNQIDYQRLRDWTLSLPGQVIACGQDGDSWVPFKHFIVTRSTPGYKRVGTSKEVIWTNASN